MVPMAPHTDTVHDVRRGQAGRILIAGAVLAVLHLPTATARAARSLTTGFTDSVYLEAPAVRDPWLQRTLQAGAQMILIPVDWASIAPSQPANPADPGDPAYRWQALDGAVRAAAAQGLKVALDASAAPRWAEGGGRPAGVPEGAWQPSAAAFGAFAQALARRYGGSFPDPGGALGARLPRVRYWQAWGEPNLTLHLAPQWVKRGHRYLPESPLLYRRLLNAFYAGVKAAHGDNLVVTAGTAPFGDPPGRARMPPAQFVRALLCVRGAPARPVPCPDPARFDVLAHDPYSIAGPFEPALNPDDVSISDMGRLSEPLGVAERTGRALPRGPKQLWVTEFSWDSNPPDPHGVPAQTHARWLEEALFELWREGVGTAIWYQVRDAPPIPDYASTYQSGVYLHDGVPKPARQAFRFPFVLRRTSATALFLWAKAPASGRLAVQRRAGRGWRTIASYSVRAGEVVYRRLSIRGHLTLRAGVGQILSLPFSVG
jgi:hypothetical protein